MKDGEQNYQLMETVGEDATMRLAWVFEYFCHFKVGWICIKSDQCPGHLSTSSKW
jgi:hypothetical protein